MNSQALQEMVKKIFGDEATKAEFLKDPAGVADRFNLTIGEKRAVLTTHAKFGLIASNSGQLEAAIRAYSPWFSPEP
jgi:hypothetical protein